MPSIFIPTKSQISTYKANPSQLKKDKEAEDYLVITDSCGFLKALSAAMRNGNTSVVYNTKTANATQIKAFLTGSDYGYGYAESDVVITPNGNDATLCSMVVSWTYSS